MATVESLTLDLYRRRTALAEQVSLTTQQIWANIDPDALDVGWDRLSGELGLAVYSGQLASAAMSPHYVETVASSQGFQLLNGSTARESYAGVAPDGAGLVPLLYGAVTTVKTGTAAGLGATRAFESGAAYLAAIVKSVIQEMGRQRDIVHMQAKGITRYVRSVSPGACSRCAILAGIYSAPVAFPRHPNCKCVAVPLAPDKKGKDLVRYENPYEYFHSLSRAEQDRIFTAAGAQAIRDGADIYQVVNVRRRASGISFGGATGGTFPNSGRRLTPVQIGVKTDGTPLLAYTTRYGTTRHGIYGRRQDASRRSQTLRLMPEQIYVMAGNDPIRARQLLERYGYIY